MNLPFSQIINGSKSYFVEKIINGLIREKLMLETQLTYWIDLKPGIYEIEPEYIETCIPKIHTFREDKANRWRPGMQIHFIINNRTKKQLQFARVATVVSVQTVHIKWFYNPKVCTFNAPCVVIDGKEIKGKALEQLALNDGFANTAAFFLYFHTDFTGKIIHWTDFKY